MNAFVNTLTSGGSASGTSGSPSSTSSSRTSNSNNLSFLATALFWPLLLFGGIIVIIIAVARSSRRNTRAAQQAAQVDAATAARAVSEANRQLLAADEQVRTSSDELAYARAQFGLSSTDEFARAIETGKAAVSRGFSALEHITPRPLPPSSSDWPPPSWTTSAPT